MQKLRACMIGLATILLVTGCGLFGGSSAAPPPPTGDGVSGVPTHTPNPLPTTMPTTPLPSSPMPTTVPVVGAGVGEVIFVREGQLWVIGADGLNERQLTQLPEDAGLRELTVAPGGRYLALTINWQRVLVVDLGTGVVEAVDEVVGGSLKSPVWSPQSDALYYRKLLPDAELGGFRSEVWRAMMPPGGVGVSQAIIQAPPDTDMTIRPAFVLEGGQVVVREARGGGGIGQTYLFDPASDSRMPFAEGFYVADIAADRTRVLLIDQAESGGLSVADIDAAGTVGDAIRLSPENDPGVYSEAQFMGDGETVLALYYVPGEGGSIVNYRTQVVMFWADDAGSYRVTLLDPNNQDTHLAYSWHPTLGVVAQRMVVETNTFELWLLPFDGSPGRRLTVGEQPVVVRE